VLRDRTDTDLLALGDLPEQVRLDRAVAVTAGSEFDDADVRHGCVHSQMNLAPLTSALHAVLSGLPFAVAKKLDAGAVHEQVKWTSARRYGICTASVFCLRHRVEKSGTGQSNPDNRSKLATMPEVCRKGTLNNTLIARQNWIAASEKSGGRPGFPLCGASQNISLSSQTSSDPRLRSAALYLDRFGVRKRAGNGLIVRHV
jgi:hypothetical protein